MSSAAVVTGALWVKKFRVNMCAPFQNDFKGLNLIRWIYFFGIALKGKQKGSIIEEMRLTGKKTPYHLHQSHIY